MNLEVSLEIQDMDKVPLEEVLQTLEVVVDRLDMGQAVLVVGSLDQILANFQIQKK